MYKQHLSYMAFYNCHGGQKYLNPFTANKEFVQSAEEETETDDIDSNLPDDSDDGLEQDNEGGGCIPDDPVLDYLDV